MASSHLLRPLTASPSTLLISLPCPSLLSLSFRPQTRATNKPSHLVVRAKAREDREAQQPKKDAKESSAGEDGVEEVEEELPWIQEKAMDLVEFTGTVTQAIPGPRVGKSPLPWILALPLAYVGISFVVAFVKTVKKFTSPRAKRKRLVNKNVFLNKSIDELFEKGKEAVSNLALKALMQKTGFSMEEILRKYIRYALNEKPFNPESVAELIHLRKATMLEDPQVAEVLNEISRRIVKEKGPVVMDTSGFTEKGFKRKIAVKALFGKIFYLSELPEFCSRDSSLIIKEMFGVTDEDADILRIHTLSDNGDIDSLQRMVDASDSEEPRDDDTSIDKFEA